MLDQEKNASKGIILAGGTGSRLFPVTIPVCKQLLPIYDKPMIYYSMSVLMLAGIREILIISSPNDINGFKKLFGTGKDLGLNISYEVQEKPNGLAEAFIIGEKFINKSNRIMLVLGDNIFYGHGLTQILKDALENNSGATIFGYYINNPRDYGVVEFDNKNKVISIKEKPEDPRFNYAVPGLYVYNNQVINIAKKIKPSNRNELEITDVNLEYLKLDKLKIKLFGRGMAWLDTGTYDNLIQASNFVETIQKRQGLYIACLEEIAYKNNWITKEKLIYLAQKLKNTPYGKYILSLVS